MSQRAIVRAESRVIGIHLSVSESAALSSFTIQATGKS